MNNEEKILSILMNMQDDISILKTNVIEVNEKVDHLETRMDRLETRMDNLENRMDNLETKMDNLETRMDNLETRMDNLENQVDNLGNRMDNLEIQTSSLRTDVNSLTFRITKLERSHYELRDEVTRINILLETQLIPIQKEILSCYFSTFQRYKESTKDIEHLKLDVDILKSTIQG